jgi:hypothetical protein
MQQSKEKVRMKARLITVVFVSAVGLLAADSPFTGTWKLNVAKSKFQGDPAPQSETVTIEAGGKVSISGTDSKGQAVNWSYTPAPEGSATIDGLPDSSVIEVQKGNMVDHTWKMGKGVMKGHGVLAKDGKTMTYTLTGTNAEGKKIKSTEIYEKQ